MSQQAAPETEGTGIRTTSRLVPAGLAGLVGGAIGFVLSRMAPEATSADSLKPSTGVWFALIMVGIGGAIIAGSYLADKRQPTGETVAIAAGALLVGGFISGYLAQALYESMLDEAAIANCLDATCYANEVRPARMLGWALAGCLGGAGVGASFRSWKRIQNGMIGGAIGGLIGGLLFDLFAVVLDTDSDVLPQLIAICFIGLFMGLLIGLIDTARTTMWLEVLSGEMSGRQYLVIDERTTVGSARTAQIRLVGDRQVSEIHFEIAQTPPSFTCRTTSPVIVNGVQSSGGLLAHGDVLEVGATQLRVGQRRGKPSNAVYVPPTAGADTTGVGPYDSRPTATQASQAGQAGRDGAPQRGPASGVNPASPSPPTARPRLPTKPKQ